MSADTTNDKKDDEMNRNTYNAVMNFSATFGVPAALALSAFFTSLVMANGFWLSVGVFIVTFVAVLLIAKTFFTH